MKTRYKIITITIISIVGFLIIPLYATNFYCDIFDSENGGCMRISGMGLIDYTSLPYFVFDSQNTGNPNECWYDDGDGNKLPCKIETGPILWPTLNSKESNCVDECHDKETGPNFRENTILVEGDMAEKICETTGGECPQYYPGNIQDDGSVMVGITTWDADTKIEKSFVFIIKNNTLSYDIRENEN